MTFDPPENDKLNLLKISLPVLLQNKEGICIEYGHVGRGMGRSILKLELNFVCFFVYFLIFVVNIVCVNMTF